VPRNSLTTSPRAEGRVDHAALPGVPAEGLEQDVPAPTPGLGLGDLVEHLVGHRVGALAVVAAAGGHQGEEPEHPQGFLGGRVEERPEALDLGVEDPVETGLVEHRDRLVGEHACAVDEARDRPPEAAELGEGSGDRGRVGDVDR